MRVYTGDSKLDSYNNKIQNNQNQINILNQRIRQINEDLEQLYALKRKLQNIRDSIEHGKSGSTGVIGGIVGSLLSPFQAVIKPNVFNKLKDVISGSNYSRAKNSSNNSIDKVNRKIKELEREREECRSGISRCQSNITTAKYQKSAYIRSKTVNM